MFFRRKLDKWHIDAYLPRRIFYFENVSVFRRFKLILDRERGWPILVIEMARR